MISIITNNIVGVNYHLDIDAKNHIDDSGITNSREIFALNETTKKLKTQPTATSNIYDKIKLFAPFSSTSLEASRYYLNRQDIKIDWVNDDGNRHSELGIKGNGIDFTGFTNFIPNQNGFTNTNFGMTIYINSNTTGNNKIDAGAIGRLLSPTRERSINTRNASGNVDFRFGTLTNYSQFTNSTSVGIYTYNRTALGETHYKNKVLLGSNADTSSLGNLAFEPNVLSNVIGGTPVQFSDRRIATLIYHDSLTDTETKTLHDIITFYNSNVSEGR